MRHYRRDYNVDLDASDDELEYNRTVRQPTFTELNSYPRGKYPPGKIYHHLILVYLAMKMK